jgi:hypothetical protein
VVTSCTIRFHTQTSTLYPHNTFVSYDSNNKVGHFPAQKLLNSFYSWVGVYSLCGTK